MDVHQCARLLYNPRLVQKHALRRIAQYLASMSTYGDLPYVNCQLTTCGVVYRFNIEKCIECYEDANFSGVCA